MYVTFVLQYIHKDKNRLGWNCQQLIIATLAYFFVGKLLHCQHLLGIALKSFESFMPFMQSKFDVFRCCWWYLFTCWQKRIQCKRQVTGALQNR